MLLDRLSRIEGQLNALKHGIERDTSGCVEVSRQLKSILQATKSFGKTYMLVYMEECLSKRQSRENVRKPMETLIESIFKF